MNQRKNENFETLYLDFTDILFRPNITEIISTQHSSSFKKDKISLRISDV